MEEKRELRYEPPKIEVLRAVDIFEKLGPSVSCSGHGQGTY
jgi:hypothetical protein